MRGNVIIIVMGAVTLLAFIFYIADFMKRKKEREANNVQ
jgi:preprotein translocase subunit SecE